MKTAVLALLLAWVVCAQDFSKVTIEKIDAGFQFTEGAVWSREGFLLFSDVPPNHIRKLVPGERSTVFREDSHGANGNTYDAQGRLYTCESRTRRVVRMDKKGQMETLAEKWEGKRFNAPNDIVVRKDGHDYFTDPAFGDQADTRELAFFGVYHITPKGVLSLIAKPTGRPNGIAFSPNGRILYVDNSDDRNVRAYDVDHNGEVSNERVVVSNINGRAGRNEGGRKGKSLHHREGGRDLLRRRKAATHDRSARDARQLRFGDPDLQTLYITARTSLYRVRLNVKGAVQYW